VYLHIENNKVEICDASYLWGKNTKETEIILTKKYGKRAKVACIGAGGEKLSLISGIVTDGGRIAARNGFGAMRGIKKLESSCHSRQQ